MTASIPAIPLPSPSPVSNDISRFDKDTRGLIASDLFIHNVSPKSNNSADVFSGIKVQKSDDFFKSDQDNDQKEHTKFETLANFDTILDKRNVEKDGFIDDLNVGVVAEEEETDLNFDLYGKAQVQPVGRSVVFAKQVVARLNVSDNDFSVATLGKLNEFEEFSSKKDNVKEEIKNMNITVDILKNDVNLTTIDDLNAYIAQNSSVQSGLFD